MHYMGFKNISRDYSRLHKGLNKITMDYTILPETQDKSTRDYIGWHEITFDHTRLLGLEGIS